MINTLTEDFENFVSKISLDATLVDDIIQKHNALSDMIRENPPEGYKILKTRLSGSYAKGTVLNEIEDTKNPDVDLVVILKTDKEDVLEINSDFLTYLIEKKGFLAEDVRQQSNSIGILYKNINVDIVLAKHNPQNIIIASNKNKAWIESNCLNQVDFMSQQRKRYGAFNYRDLMKIFKYLNKEGLSNQLSSYTLEMLVHGCVPKPKIGQRLHEVVAETLQNIASIPSIYVIRDCCDSALNGFDEKDEFVFDAFKNEINIISKKAQEAMDGDRKKWEEIFGDVFPTQPDTKVRDTSAYDRTQTPWCNE